MAGISPPSLVPEVTSSTSCAVPGVASCVPFPWVYAGKTSQRRRDPIVVWNRKGTGMRIGGYCTDLRPSGAVSDLLIFHARNTIQATELRGVQSGCCDHAAAALRNWQTSIDISGEGTTRTALTLVWSLWGCHILMSTRHVPATRLRAERCLSCCRGKQTIIHDPVLDRELWGFGRVARFTRFVACLRLTLGAKISVMADSRFNPQQEHSSVRSPLRTHRRPSSKKNISYKGRGDCKSTPRFLL